MVNMENKTNLFKALSSFIQEVPVIHQDTKGYGYTYSNLTAILKVINPLMSKHGIGFSQLVQDDKVVTIVFHSETGESIISETKIPTDVVLKGMNAFQVLGSAITYIRRYALSSMLGLVTDKDIDACGEVVSAEEIERKKQEAAAKIKQKQEAEKLAKEVAAQRVIEVEAELKACRNTKELGAFYLSLSAVEQKQFKDFTTELKIKFTKDGEKTA